MAGFVRTIEVARPAWAVWAVLEDVRRLPELSTSSVEVRDAPERLTTPGQTFVQVVRAAGRGWEAEWSVMELVPEQVVVIEGSAGFGVRQCLRHELTPLAADRTQVTTTVTYTLPMGVLGRMAGKLGVEKLAEREAGDVLARLKQMVEREVVADH